MREDEIFKIASKKKEKEKTMTGRRPPHLYSAAYVLLWEGRKVLLSKRLNTGFKDGLFGLPGGHVNPGENPIAAAVREV